VDSEARFRSGPLLLRPEDQGSVIEGSSAEMDSEACSHHPERFCFELFKSNMPGIK
jgi:hypothetical protein